MPRCIASTPPASTWRSAASGRCSSPIPVAAFANIAAALRPGARLALLVWQRREHNEWARAIEAALGDAAQPPQPGADPFSLGDAEATAHILEDAGFDGTRFEDVHEPVLYGHDLDAALEFVRGFQDTSA